MAVGLLAAMFLSFILQIVSRYVFRHPLGWTVEVCVTCWLWIVFWGCAFVIDERDHVKFDMIYAAVNVRLRRIFALVSAVAILITFLVTFVPTLDYIAFLKIKKSSTLDIRLDWVFSIYGIFMVAIIARYALRVWHLVRGGPPDIGSAAATDKREPSE